MHTHLITTPPRIERLSSEWHVITMPAISARSDEVERIATQLGEDGKFSKSEALTKAQELRWEELTEVKTKESSFVLCIPIHNEEGLLRSTLAAFNQIFLPTTVNATVVFFTNACSDSSLKIVTDFMSSFSAVKSQPLPKRFSKLDPFLNTKYQTVRNGSHCFVHLDSAFPSKANAIRVVNHLADLANIPIMMSLDANNWLEPDSLAKMFKKAHSVFISKPDKTGMLTGWTKYTKPPTANGPLSLWQKFRDKGRVVSEGKGIGPFMSWPTAFIEKNGLYYTATEDFALMLQQKSLGLNVECLKETPVWGYQIATFAEQIAAETRYIRGFIQLTKICESEDNKPLAALLNKSQYQLRFTKRVLRLVDNILKRPMWTPVRLAEFVRREFCYWKAARDYAKDPVSSTWEPLQHCKGTVLLKK